jgi:hypothetical protein
VVGFIDNDSRDDRSCADAGRDAVTRVTSCVSQRLSHYRATGQFAVTFGWPVLQRRLAARIDAALGRPVPANAPRTAAEAAGTSWPAREDARGADEPPPAAEPEAVMPADAAQPEMTASVAEPLAATTSKNGHSTRVADLAIPGYDTLSASQVVERLAGLPADDLDEVRGYEAAHRNRRTILGKIDQLRGA